MIPVRWEAALDEHERGIEEQFWETDQDMLRLDDHVPLPEFALPGGSFWLSLLMLAAAIATICVVGLAVHLAFS